MKHFHCPVNGWDCPYFKNSKNHHCVCTMEDPMVECEDFAYIWEGYEDPEAYTDDHEIEEE